MNFLKNPRANRCTYTAEEARIVSVASARRALGVMSDWHGYQLSPLWHLSRLAQIVGINSLMCKDESHRFGLGSFKALGGAYAVGLTLDRRGPKGPVTVCCATDGNHGRSVAAGARRHGCRCVVFMHAGAPESKAQVIRQLGAEVVRTPGNYDDSVIHANRVAAERGWLLISDTSDNVDDVVAAQIMQGYAIMALELQSQLDCQWPTHIFLQGGVGGLAAAIAGVIAETVLPEPPSIIVVEPQAAACLMACVAVDRPTRLQGDLETNMAMLSCGKASAPAWAILRRRADAFIAVSDGIAKRAALLLRTSGDAWGEMVVSASGAAGLAGLLFAIADPQTSSHLRLEPTSRVLIFATEGASNG